GAFTITFAQGSNTIQSLHASTSALELRGGTLNVRFSSELDSTFTLDGGTLGVEGPLTLTGDTLWTAGMIDHDGPLINNATDTLAGSSAKFLRGTLPNSGTIVHTGSADLQVTAFARLNNQDTGVYDLQTDAGIVGEGAFTGQFNNLGTLLKSAGTGTSLVSAVNNQGGLIHVQTGTIGLGRAGKTHTGGTFVAEAGATLDLTSGSSNDRFTGSYTGWGDGRILLANGSLTLGGAGAT